MEFGKMFAVHGKNRLKWRKNPTQKGAFWSNIGLKSRFWVQYGSEIWILGLGGVCPQGPGQGGHGRALLDSAAGVFLSKKC